MVTEYLRLYTTESPRWDDVAHLVETMDWTDFVNSTTLEYLTARGISEKWIKEMVESATRVNYGQVCHLHVTLLITRSERPNPEYFGFSPKTEIPKVVLTTYEGARAGGVEPAKFNSISYHGQIGRPESEDQQPEYRVKIFSKERISDEWLEKMFGNVGWVYRKEVCLVLSVVLRVMTEYMRLVGRISGSTANDQVPPGEARSGIRTVSRAISALIICCVDRNCAAGSSPRWRSRPSLPGM